MMKSVDTVGRMPWLPSWWSHGNTEIERGGISIFGILSKREFFSGGIIDRYRRLASTSEIYAISSAT